VFQITAYEAVIVGFQFECRRTGIVHAGYPVLLGERQDTLNAAHCHFSLTAMQELAEWTNVFARLSGASEQLNHAEGRAPRTVFVLNTVASAFSAPMFAQQLAILGIDQTDYFPVPLHMDAAADPAWWRAVVSRLHFDTSIKVDRAHSIWPQSGHCFAAIGNSGTAPTATAGEWAFPLQT
jgi:hypothetical protein